MGKKKDMITKETLSSIKEIGLKSIKNKTVEELIVLFGDLCLPFDEGEGEKEKKFLELLKDYNASYEKDIGIVVPSLKETKRVVVSHMDLINPFNRGFKKGKTYKIGLNNAGEHILMGALDNTFTNAIVMKALIELRDQGLAQDTTFVFTEREEIDFGGMRGYLKKYGNKPLFINLDVTSDNRKYHTSMEFDEPNWDICKQIDKQSKVFTSGFTTDREGDDTDAVIRSGGQGFSYCIPTWKTIHSYSNYTLVENILPYYEGMLFLIAGLNLDKGIEHNIKEFSISKALKFKKYNEFAKAEKKAIKKEKKRRDKERAEREKAWDNRASGYSYKDRYYNGDISRNTMEESLVNKFDEISEMSGTYFDFGKNGLQTEESFLNSITDNALLDDNAFSELTGSEKKIKNIHNEISKRGYPEIMEIDEALNSVFEDGSMITFTELYQMIYDNADHFGLKFDDEEAIESVTDNIMSVIIDIGGLKIVQSGTNMEGYISS